MSELLKFAKDLGDAGRDVAEKVYPAVRQAASELRDEWRDNAKLTARRHGKHYPKSITCEQIPESGAAVWEVGPQLGLKQGSMGAGFEYGGPTQPPHLDGARAFTATEPTFIKAIEDIVKDAL